jgi:AcrR family transcriptional regulator
MSECDSGGLGVTSAIAPLYQRLPRGPHRLSPTEVAHHQRLRMHGAMVEAVAANGYAGTSVKQVIGLAGVSRRAFYEQFANKQECFLATFDLIVARGVTRINEAYRSSDGEMEQRIRAAVGGFVEEVETNVKGAGLTIVQAQTAGAPGLARMRRAMGTLEQALSSSFAHAPDLGPLPVPIVRGIVGGLHEAMSVRLRTGRSEEIPALGEEIVRWTLLFHTPAIDRLSELLAERARAGSAAEAQVRLLSDLGGSRPEDIDSTLEAWMPPGVHAVSSAGAHGSGVASGSEEQLRRRLRASVLNLAVVEDYHELSAPQIAEEAGIPIESFFELFTSKEECFLAAFDELSDELLLLAADPDLIAGDWPRAVRRVLGELLDLLAARPLYAQIIACEAPGACPEALERDCDLLHGIATLLTEGAPGEALNKLAVDGIAGAIWHTIRCLLASGQIQLLPALSDYLAYIVLTPFIGADAAAEILIEERAELAA